MSLFQEICDVIQKHQDEHNRLRELRELDYKQEWDKAINSITPETIKDALNGKIHPYLNLYGGSDNFLFSLNSDNFDFTNKDYAKEKLISMGFKIYSHTLDDKAIVFGIK